MRLLKTTGTRSNVRINIIEDSLQHERDSLKPDVHNMSNNSGYNSNYDQELSIAEMGREIN